MRRRWYVTIDGPGVINPAVSRQAGMPVKAWTRAGAERKALSRYSLLKGSRVTSVRSRRI